MDTVNPDVSFAREVVNADYAPEPSTDEMLAFIERQRILAECFGPLTITEYQGRHTAVMRDTDLDRDAVWEGATRREAIERVYWEFV